MKILIADDEYNNRLLLSAILGPYGACDMVINGQEAVEAFECALEEKSPYDLVCLDIMMPEMDGQQALVKMRQLESENNREGVDASVIFMVSALDTESQVVKAFFRGNCTDYLTKPITREKLLAKLKEYHLLEK